MDSRPSLDRAVAHSLNDLGDLETFGLDIVAADARGLGPGSQRVRVGYHRRSEPLPAVDEAAFDILVTDRLDAPRPWVSLASDSFDDVLGKLETTMARHPAAATTAAQVLRLSLGVPFEQALVIESLAYSMLLSSGEFKAWRRATPIKPARADDAPRVVMTRAEGELIISLNRPLRRNAVDASLRDELVEALKFALADPDQARVRLEGGGSSFCAGGDLDEFGTAQDAASAHFLRLAQSPTRLLHQLGDRVTSYVHGACIGAGTEMPAAAHRVLARPDALFRLPEVMMGLIPGAGGCASVPRRIGRHRTCYMVLTACAVPTPIALVWGLVDGVAGLT